MCVRRNSHLNAVHTLNDNVDVNIRLVRSLNLCCNAHQPLLKLILR